MDRVEVWKLDERGDFRLMTVKTGVHPTKSRAAELLPLGDLFGIVRSMAESAAADEAWARSTLKAAKLPTDLYLYRKTRNGLKPLKELGESPSWREVLASSLKRNYECFSVDALLAGSPHSREWFAVDVLKAARQLRIAADGNDLEVAAAQMRRMTLSGVFGRFADRLDRDALFGLTQRFAMKERGKRGAKTNTEGGAIRKAAVARVLAALPEEYKTKKSRAAPAIRRKLLDEGIKLSTDRIRHLI